MSGPVMRKDPKTGALIFSESPEAQILHELQGLRLEVQNLQESIKILMEQIKER